jgi:hypothetical protein
MGRKDATLDEVLDMIDIVTARSGRQPLARDQLHLLKLVCDPHSLAASLAALPSMSLIPVVPFAKNDPARRAWCRRSPRPPLDGLAVARRIRPSADWA